MVTNLFEFRPRVHFFFSTSAEAAAWVQDGALALVFVDGAHDGDSVREDLALWWPKVRAGGVLSGHDYLLSPFLRSFGVVAAVDAFCERYGLQLHLGPDSIWWVDKPADETPP